MQTLKTNSDAASSSSEHAATPGRHANEVTELQTRVGEATGRADKAGPPDTFAPVGSPPPRGFCAGLARGSEHVFRSEQAVADAQVAHKRMTAAEAKVLQTNISFDRLKDCLKEVETERDVSKKNGERLMLERDAARTTIGCAARWSVLSALQQRTADGHGESVAGRRIRRSLSSRGSWLRDTKRRTIYVSRSTAEVLPLPPRIFALPFSLVLV